MTTTNRDLGVLTTTALNHAYDDLLTRLADYSGVYSDQLHERLQAIMDELHDRAGDEHKRFLYCAAGGHMLRACLSCDAWTAEAEKIRA